MGLDVSTYEKRITNSALWAAAGDALGWITELTDERGLQFRTGASSVQQPVPWQRIIGGRQGVRVDLPAGVYSDDTQLRLSVCRAIRGDGQFDAEVFAKIELPVWLSYSLGAGRGTKTAATNLARRDVNWFSNFFRSKDQNYLHGGGNGAAMRVQPHVWKSGLSGRRHGLDVLRDALITHGHPHGFVGALFHAVALSRTLELQSPLSISDIHDCLEACVQLPRLVEEDEALSAFWRPAWEIGFGESLNLAVAKTVNEAHTDINRVSLAPGDPFASYLEALNSLGLLSDKFRGSGLKTALAANILVFFCRGLSIEETLIVGANALGSDTDTIATMAGALLGIKAERAPNWPIQDRNYIETEAKRIARISAGQPQDSFSYPDLDKWNPPATQSDGVGIYEDGLALAGLGPLIEDGPIYSNGDTVWQWAKLPFGQTVFIKRRQHVRKKVPHASLPDGRRKVGMINRPPSSSYSPKQTSFNLPNSNSERPAGDRSHSKKSERTAVSQSRSVLDELTDVVIRSNFDDRTIGEAFNQCLDQSSKLEDVVAFASIVAKAKLARMKKR